MEKFPNNSRRGIFVGEFVDAVVVTEDVESVDEVEADVHVRELVIVCKLVLEKTELDEALLLDA